MKHIIVDISLLLLVVHVAFVLCDVLWNEVLVLFFSLY
jgi:hypothetical protein